MWLISELECETPSPESKSSIVFIIPHEFLCYRKIYCRMWVAEEILFYHFKLPYSFIIIIFNIQCFILTFEEMPLQNQTL